jgi:UDP-N-acetylenolpyruvoylglucosamine reductase
MNSYTSFINQYKGRIRLDEPLAKYTTMKIGGRSDFFIETSTSDDFASILKSARITKLPILIIGGGSNLLISDNGFRGLVIKNNTRDFSICAIKGLMKQNKSEKEVFVKASSGVIFNQFVRYSIEQGFAGIHMHLGLPGTVGGAVVGNSKWMNPPGFVGDTVYQATIFTKENEIRIVPKSYFQFKYGSSIVSRSGDIVLDVIFKFLQSDPNVLWKIANESIAYRRLSQPQGVASAGCTFKNISHAEAIIHAIPNGYTSAGFLIDHVGLKGYRIGDAEISKCHANFIVNNGKATASDVLKLIELTQKKVYDVYGILLQNEVIKIGDF